MSLNRKVETHAGGAGRLAAAGRFLPTLLRQGGRTQADRHAGQERPRHHRGHEQGRQGALGGAQQVHDQGKDMSTGRSGSTGGSSTSS